MEAHRLWHRGARWCASFAGLSRGASVLACLGCHDVCACAGEELSAACTLGYAAPEVVRALAEGRRVEIAGAHDVWALGVMVFEAFTGGPAIAPTSGRQHVIDLANGHTSYLWECLTENESANTAEVCRVSEGLSTEQASAFLRSKARGAVVACLQREPEECPSAAQLLEMLNELGLQ